jgi:hypothetical protein
MERKPVRSICVLIKKRVKCGIPDAPGGEDACGKCELNPGDLMKNVSKLVVRMGLLSLLSVMPLAAQIDKGVDFTASFPFYAGNTRMPAGSYKITQFDMETNILQIQSNDGVHSALVEIIPTHSAQPHPHSDVTFHKYGDTEYLNRIWVEGQQYGMKVDPTKAETKAAANANVVKHSLSANLP